MFLYTRCALHITIIISSDKHSLQIGPADPHGLGSASSVRAHPVSGLGSSPIPKARLTRLYACVGGVFAQPFTTTRAHPVLCTIVLRRAHISCNNFNHANTHTGANIYMHTPRLLHPRPDDKWSLLDVHRLCSGPRILFSAYTFRHTHPPLLVNV
jgi:hypothetical protein